MKTNIHAQRAVLRNLALGLPPTANLKTVSEVRGFKITLAALVSKRWVTVDADVQGRVRLTPAGQREASVALRRHPTSGN